MRLFADAILLLTLRKALELGLDSKYNLRSNFTTTRFLLSVVGTRFVVIGVSMALSIVVRTTIDFRSTAFRLLLEGLNVSKSCFYWTNLGGPAVYSNGP